MTPPESTQELAPDPLEAAAGAGGKVIRGGSLRATGHVVGVLTGVVSAPLVVRHLGVEDYGRFVLVTSIIYVITGLTEGGLANVAVRRYAVADRLQRRSLIANLMGLRMVLSAVGAVGALAFAGAAGYPGVVVAGVAFGALALLANNLWGALHTALVAELRLVAVAGVEMTRAVLTTIGFLVLVLAGTGLLPFYAVAPGVAVIALAFTAFVARDIAPRRPAFQLDQWRSLLRETAIYAAATALGAVYFQVALVSTSLLTDDTETGLFGVAFRIVDLANGVPWLLAGSVFPVLAHAAANDPHRLRYAVGRVTEAGVIAGGLVAVTFVLGAQFAIDVVAGQEAQGSVAVLRILSIGVLATFLVAAWGFVLLSLERYRDLVIANASALALAVLLSVVLIPAFGAKGSGAVTATLEICLAATYGLLIARRRPDLRPSGAIIPKVALALAAAFAVGLPLLMVHPVVATAGGVGTYLALVWALKAIPPELLAALPRRRSS